MRDVDTKSAPPLVDPLFELRRHSDEITHIICCRDVSWRRALCGESSDRLVMTARDVCTMCVEVADGMRPGWRANEDVICPVDGRSCPSDEEMNAEMVRRSVPK